MMEDSFWQTNPLSKYLETYSLIPPLYLTSSVLPRAVSALAVGLFLAGGSCFTRPLQVKALAGLTPCS